MSSPKDGDPESAVSAIDLGTNTVLMVTARRRHDGDLEVVDDAHAIARLGQGVDATGDINDDAVSRVCKILSEYRQRAQALGSHRIRAFGTSALRDAGNREHVISQVLKHTGIELGILTGDEEAGLTFSGACFGLTLPERYAVLDIGGGSTELALGNQQSVERSVSVDIGAVRITERFFTQLPPTREQLHQADRWTREVLQDLFVLSSTDTLVGVAGTVTTLGALDVGTENFSAPELNGHRLLRDRARDLARLLQSMSLEQTRALPQVSDQRADIIAGGAFILTSALDQLNVPEIVVSTWGIRYGLLLSMLDGEV
ncbi:MAG: Ppx/GppA phosphatase family protein [Candidatus Latescibacterota bacterium]|nr:Ppx/GppA phosphatase family protein [Candidatus Latescibacterota bacterium]